MMSGCIDIVNYSYAWMDMWTYTIMSLATTIVVGLLAQTLEDWPEFLGHSWSSNANDVKVHWLRPQTHMEWFPHSLHTYTMCFRSFIWSGWADGSTIMPLLVTSTGYPHSWPTSNSVKVHWLRLQIHMEGFPHPLQSITRR